MKKAKSIYIHIPFCTKICSYCDFTKLIPQRVDEYIDALVNELQNKVDLSIIYETVYFGGGTPSVLNLEQLEKLFNFINKIKISKNYEMTFEANVESLNYEKLNFLYNNKVNRLSIGMQTLDNKLLKIINRDHTKEDFIKILKTANEIGFDNINIDLMFALPSQTMEMLNNDLEQIIDLNVKHISSYSLILEENTVFYKLRDKYNFIDEEEEYKMFEKVMNFFKEKGFVQYEVSNYCKEGYASKHNNTYWDSNEYIGAGLGASGYENSFRYENTKNINTYIEQKNIVVNIENISTWEKQKEFFLLGLRKTNGISYTDFYNRFGEDAKIIFKNELSQLRTKKLIIENNDIILLAPEAIFVANDVFELFI